MNNNSNDSQASGSFRSQTRADGDQTRQRILDSAGQLYARDGLAATTNKAIAAAAGVDLASINYHFGNRAGLYQAVLVEAHRRIVSLDYLQELEHSEIPVADKLRQLIGFVCRLVVAERGWNIRVLAREIMAPSMDLGPVFELEFLPKIAIVRHWLAELTDRDAADPLLALALVQLVGPCLMMLVTDERLPSPVQRVRAMQHEPLADAMFGFLMAGLESLRRDRC